METERQTDRQTETEREGGGEGQGDYYLPQPLARDFRKFFHSLKRG